TRLKAGLRPRPGRRLAEPRGCANRRGTRTLLPVGFPSGKPPRPDDRCNTGGLRTRGAPPGGTRTVPGTGSVRGPGVDRDMARFIADNWRLPATALTLVAALGLGAGPPRAPAQG